MFCLEKTTTWPLCNIEKRIESTAGKIAFNFKTFKRINSG